MNSKLLSVKKLWHLISAFRYLLVNVCIKIEIRSKVIFVSPFFDNGDIMTIIRLKFLCKSFADQASKGKRDGRRGRG